MAEVIDSYDPKLKDCVNEITAICKRYDVGGHLSLVSKTHGEFAYVFPEWTGLRPQTTEDGIQTIRLKIKRSELGEEAATEMAGLTAHYLCVLNDMAEEVQSFAKMAIASMDEKYEITHEKQKPRPHRELEN